MTGDRSHLRLTLSAVAGLALLVLSAARAQQMPAVSHALPFPRLVSVTPAGAKVGTTVDVTIAGADLEDPTELRFSNPSFKAEAIQPPAPPPPDPKNPPKDPPKPPPVTQFKVTVPPGTPAGLYDVRVVNKWGVSNPKAFVVGDLNEVAEKEPNNNDTEAQKVELGTTVTGVISAGTDVDYTTFAGKKGQRVILSCLALSIDSRMWANLQVFDTQGNQIASNSRYGGARHHGNFDALCDVTLPADGDYVVRTAHFTYTLGGPDYYYRLSISTGPWIDAVFPPMVEPGKATQVTVWGRNLPGGQPDPAAVVDGRTLDKLTVQVTPPADPLATQKLIGNLFFPATVSGMDGFEYRLASPAGSSNGLIMTYALAPVVLDNTDNDTPEKAQAVTLPCEIAGRVEKKRDRDWYTFTAKKGDVFNIEVTSDRLGAPTDMYFLLRNPATKTDIVEGDETTDALGLKLFARTDDPQTYRFAVPADGPYQLLVGSRLADNLADARHVYGVRITPEVPDFRLVVMPPDFYRPDSCVLNQGGSQCFSVYAWRQDGFNGDITLSVEGLPAGVTCPPQVMAAGQKATTLSLTATAEAAAWTGEIKIKGSATIKGQPAVREARGAGVVTIVQPQQNIPTLARMERGIFLTVRDKSPFGLVPTIDKATMVLDPKAGDKATITLKLTRIWPDLKQPLTITVADQTQNLLLNNNQPVTIAPDKDTATVPVQINPNSPLLPGTYNVVFRAQTQIPYNKDPMAKQKNPLNVLLPSAPVAITVVPKEVATVTATAPNPNVKVGEMVEVVVKVQRKYEFAGEFKVELALPQGVAGVSAAAATIPAGADEVKLMLKAAPDAAPGARNELIVRATAMYNPQTPTVQEAKINVNVVK